MPRGTPLHSAAPQRVLVQRRSTLLPNTVLSSRPHPYAASRKPTATHPRPDRSHKNHLARESASPLGVRRIELNPGSAAHDRDRRRSPPRSPRPRKAGGRQTRPKPRTTPGIFPRGRAQNPARGAPRPGPCRQRPPRHPDRAGRRRPLPSSTCSSPSPAGWPAEADTPGWVRSAGPSRRPGWWGEPHQTYCHGQEGQPAPWASSRIV